MPTIPQRELRNNVAAILRRAEAGERFTVTVSGRAVAAVVPLEEEHRRGTEAGLARVLRSTPVDDGFLEDILRMREEDREDAVDPWADTEA